MIKIDEIPDYESDKYFQDMCSGVDKDIVIDEETERKIEELIAAFVERNKDI